MQRSIMGVPDEPTTVDKLARAINTFRRVVARPTKAYSPYKEPVTFGI